MRLVKLIAISALILGAPVLTSDFHLGDTGAVYAKGKGGGNGGGGNGGGKGGGNGGGGGADKGNKSDAKAARGNSGGQRGAKSNRNGGNILKQLFGKKKDKAVKTQRATAKPSRPAASQRTTKTVTRQKPVKASRNVTTAAAPKASKRPPALPESRPKNVHAQLKGLNSLNRNINGLMNSSDAKMDGFRAFVVASATYETAKAALTEAQATYDPLAADYAALLEPLGLEMPATQEEFDALSAELSAIANAPAPIEDDFKLEDGTTDTDAYNKAMQDWSQAVTNATLAETDYADTFSAWQAVDTASTQVSDSEEAASEDAMIAAMVDGLNATGAGPVTEEDMSPEMIDWVSAQLGVGEEQTGLIDAYMAQGEASAEADDADDLDDDSDDDDEEDEDEDDTALIAADDDADPT